MISGDRFRDLGRLLDEAEHEGATVDVGGKPYVHPYFGGGSYFYPTVVGNPPSGSRVAQLERACSIFGMCTMRLVLMHFISVRSCCADPEL